MEPVKRKVPEQFTNVSYDGWNAPKAWLDGYDTASASVAQVEAERDALARRVADLEQGYTSLRNECRALLGVWRNSLVQATTLHNVQVLEQKVAKANDLLPDPPVRAAGGE